MKRSVSICVLLLLTAAVAAHPLAKKPEKGRKARRSEQRAPEPASDSAAISRQPVMPSFMGGSLEDFRSWIASHVTYSEEMYRLKLEGRVTVVFVVGRDGALSVTDVLDSPDLLLTGEVVRVLKFAPRWTPGMLYNEQTGEMEPVPVQFILPVDFVMRKPNTKPVGNPGE